MAAFGLLVIENLQQDCKTSAWLVSQALICLQQKWNGLVPKGLISKGSE